MTKRAWIAIGVLLAACSPEDDVLLGLPGPEGSSVEGGAWSASVPGDLSACSAARQQVVGDECSRSERALAPDDADALGFEASAFLALITGEHRSELTWQAGEAPGARTELTLNVEPRSDVRFVSRTSVRQPEDDGFTTGNNGARYLDCGDRLAVDAQLTIVSADGALNERVDAIVEADSDRYARITITSSRENLAGNILGSEPGDDPQEGLDELTLSLGISSFGLEASVAAHPQLVPASMGAQSCTTLGSMTLGSGCSPWGAVPLGPGEQVLGLSVEDAIAFANAASPATLLDNGAQLTLAFEASPEPVCVGIDTPAALPSIVQFPARVQLASSDGRVGGSVDVLLTAEASRQTLQKVTALASYLVPVPDGLAELAPSYAILEPLVWSERESGGFELFAEARADGARGVLRAYGDELGCEGTRPCEEVCPGPGCTASPVEKWGVRWGAPVIGENDSEAF